MFFVSLYKINGNNNNLVYSSYLSIYLIYLSIYLFVCLSIHLSIHPSIHPYHPYHPYHLSIHLSIHPSINRKICRLKTPRIPHPRLCLDTPLGAWHPWWTRPCPRCLRWGRLVVLRWCFPHQKSPVFKKNRQRPAWGMGVAFFWAFGKSAEHLGIEGTWKWTSSLSHIH